MIDLRRAGTSAVLATVAFIVLLGARPLPLDRIVAGYALALAAIALAALTAALTAARGRPPSRFEQELRREQIPPSRPAELVRVERELTLASSNAGHLHRRLRPLLQEIVAVRLDIDLDRQADVARDRLDDATWALIRPDAAPPGNPSAPGLPLRRIRSIVETLERL